MNAQWGIAMVVGIAAVIEDVARRQISNWISLTAVVAGLAWQIWTFGWMGVAYGVAGAAVGLSVFLAFYLLGGMGGGDVKLMAGFGALLGAWKVLQAALWIAGVGGLLAVAALACKFLWRKIVGPPPVALTAEEKQAQDSIPYAPAIALGVALTLLANT